MTFTCAKCGGFKPVEGRKKFKVTKRDIKNRPVYNYQCADCQKETIE